MNSSSKNKVVILVSTYNGEKYLAEQLDSIIAQKGVNIEIMVRDDGSTDETIKILDDYKKRGFLDWYTGENIGSAKSFLDLLKNAPDANYYAFSDQDDVWLPEKINKAVTVLESKDYDGPKLYFGNQYCWRNGEIAGRVKEEMPSFDKYDCTVMNPTFGCTQVFNKELIELIRSHFPSFIWSHDYLVYLVAMYFGEVYYDHEAYMKYRLHGDNQNGAGNTFRELWHNRYKAFKNILNDHNREYMLQDFLTKYGNIINEDDREIVEIPAYYRKDLNSFFRLLFSKKYGFHRLENDFWLKLRILIHHF